MKFLLRFTFLMLVLAGFFAKAAPIRPGFEPICTNLTVSKSCMSDVATSDVAAAVQNQCQREWTAHSCDKFAQDHPEAAANGDLLDCNSMSNCRTPSKIGDTLATCAAAWKDAWSDSAIFFWQVLTGEAGMPSEDDLAKLEYFKNCTSSQCKREMLGPFSSYFTKEEIEGHPERTDLNPEDPANQNYLQGFSAAVLYRKLLLRLKKDIPNGTMDSMYIEPWSGKAAKIPLSFNELINETLAKAGLTETACLNSAAVTELRCYAFFTIMDPLIVAGAAVKGPELLASLAKLAAKGGRARALLSRVTKRAEQTAREARRRKTRVQQLAKLKDSNVEGISVADRPELTSTRKGAKFRYSPDKTYYKEADPREFSKRITVDPEATGRIPQVMREAEKKHGIRFYVDPQAAYHNAHAYAKGNDVYFSPQFMANPDLDTLLHEIKHTTVARKNERVQVSKKPNPDDPQILTGKTYGTGYAFDEVEARIVGHAASQDPEVLKHAKAFSDDQKKIANQVISDFKQGYVINTHAGLHDPQVRIWIVKDREVQVRLPLKKDETVMDTTTLTIQLKEPVTDLTEEQLAEKIQEIMRNRIQTLDSLDRRRLPDSP